MSIAPRHDWTYYDARSQESDAEWFRSSTPSERAALYFSMFDLVWNARDNAAGNWDRLEKWQWDQKCALRRRMVQQFNQWDQRQSERRAAHHVS